MNTAVAFLAVATLLAVISTSAAASSASYGGGGVSIPAPPCPKNYLFSCQPNLSPAPCSPPAAAYGSAGSYSENYPTIVNAPYPGYQPGGGYQFNNVPQFPQFYGQGGGSSN